MYLFEGAQFDPSTKKRWTIAEAVVLVLVMLNREFCRCGSDALEV